MSREETDPFRPFGAMAHSAAVRLSGSGKGGTLIGGRIAAGRGEQVLVINRPDHVAGNAFDGPDKNAIVHHRYRPHIFHTNGRRVWDYLSRFTDWRPYRHRMLAMEGCEVPFNLDSIGGLFPRAWRTRCRGG